jgi:septal ring factor EnvC (AmiA/AmiB activator)
MRSYPRTLWPVTAILLVSTLGFAQADMSPGPGLPLSPSTAQDVDAELNRVNQELRQTDAKLEYLRSEGDVVRKRMIARGRTYYRLTHAGLLPLGAGFDSLMDHTSKVERLRRSLHRDAQAAKGLNQEHLALLERRKALIDRQQPLEMKRRAMADAHAALMEADDRKRAFERAFSSSGPSLGSYTAVYGAPADPSSSGSDPLRGQIGGFRSLEGRLPFPLAGRTEIRMVRRPGAGGPGVEMLAPVGTAVLAVHTGRVAFADDYGSYGNVVILDHGEQYFSVCGDLGTVDVRVGEEVGAGARIGTVGRSKTGQGVLYFELRHGADTVDPSRWFGI